MWLLSVTLATLLASYTTVGLQPECRGPPGEKKLKYLWGDALTDTPDCVGPDGSRYPVSEIEDLLMSNTIRGPTRTGRMMHTAHTPDPFVVQRQLLHNFAKENSEPKFFVSRGGRAMQDNTTSCEGPPSRMCRTKFNTTAPMYGVSLTSGGPVKIVQKFPDLLQQVVFEVCDSTECDIVYGECTQTYIPYLFLVIPLGPVTLAGQDYIMVESGCTCKPKYSSSSAPVSSLDDVMGR